MTNKKEKVAIYKQPWVHSLAAIVIIFGALAAFLYWQSVHNVIAIDTSYLDAPIVNLSASNPGTLNAIYVKEGDRVDANSPVALVGSETVYAKEGGIISSAPRAIGSYFSPGQTIISIVVDGQMRVVGSIEENKGLNDIAPGQRALFTVDAFPGKEYEGIVDEISPASSDTGIAFSISDKRPVKNFSVYMQFDVSKYPELKTGMSARAWIYIK